MPITISKVKMIKIMHYYLKGLPQLTVAEKCFINQSTVSRYIDKFKKEASIKGIMAAAEEYKVMNEVSALRSLAGELYKNKTGIEEAKSGAKMVAIFNSLDVPPEEYKVHVKMLKKLKNPAFLKAGMKLVKLEETAGKCYKDIVDEFEKLGEEIAARQGEINTLKENQEKEEKTIENLETTRKEKEYPK